MDCGDLLCRKEGRCVKRTPKCVEDSSGRPWCSPVNGWVKGFVNYGRSSRRLTADKTLVNTFVFGHHLGVLASVRFQLSLVFQVLGNGDGPLADLLCCKTCFLYILSWYRESRVVAE